MKKCKTNKCFSDAVCADGRCADHTRAVKSLRPYARRSYPKKSTPHLGVEIECFGGGAKQYKTLLALSRTPHRDGSLPTYGCEFKLCMPVETAIERVPQFVQRLVLAGARINMRCGLHVHLDARGVSAVRRGLFMTWMRSWQDWWLSLVPESRRDGDFCLPLCTTHGSHYTWINQSGYDTIEIRLHPGTLNPHKIRAWLMVCGELTTRWLRGSEEFPVMGNENYAIDARLGEVFSSPLAIEYLHARRAAHGVLTYASPQNDVEEEEF